MKRKVLVALIQPEEWNQYTPFNGYISTLKKDYDHVVGVIAENPLILLSEADEYYTMKNDSSIVTYPNLLETSSRENNSFINSCAEKIKEDFKDDDLTFVSWQKTAYHPGIVDIRGDATKVYRTSFANAQTWYKTDKLVYPTIEAYNRMKEKYSDIFDDKTFIVLTRNFQNKAPGGNTKAIIPNFEGLIGHLIDNGIKIVNIGFPFLKCNIDSENYIEIDGKFSQDELISLFYLSQGVMLQANAGGFASHLSANADMFVLTHEWFTGNDFSSFELISHKTKKVKTLQLKEFLKLGHLPKSVDNFDGILNELKNHKPTIEIKFQEYKKITYV